MKNYLIFSLLILSFASCGKADRKTEENTISSGSNPLGFFSSTSCFKNKLASEGYGQDVWTRASMDFKSNGEAINNYELFTDQDCTISAAQGTNEIDYAFIKKIDSVTVIQIDQLNDPNDLNSTFRYWILGVLSQDGYTMDIEYASGNSGPYTTEPGKAEVDSFLANINSRGVLFKRQ